MPVNAGPEYIAAEKKYLAAQTLGEKITCLEEMIKTAPKHKSSENFVAELKKRLKKLVEQSEKSKKRGRGKPGIKKEDLQAVIIGKTRAGKSTFLSALTNASPEISYNEIAKFTTKIPVIGMLDYNEVPIQLIEIPAIESEYYDRGIANSADAILIMVNDLNQIDEIKNILTKAEGKQIIVFNSFDKSSEELRKLDATLKSKKYNYVIIDLNSEETNRGLEELKEKLFQSFEKIRVFTKEPGKNKSNKPIILLPDSNVKNVAEKILHGFSNKIKETRIWGPSSKYPGQVVSLSHKLKDMDVVEFKTK